MEEYQIEEISLGEICNAFSLKKDEVIDAYLLGSRLWGTSNSTSDYDLYIIIPDKSNTTNSIVYSQKGFSSIHKGNYDALIITESVYTERLNSCTVFDLVTFWVPESHTIKDTKRNFYKSNWKLNRKNLYLSTEKLLIRDWEVAKKHCLNGNVAKSKKIIVHSIRILLMAIQIAKSETINQFDCADDFVHSFMYNYSLKDWDSIEIEATEVKNKLLKELEDLCTT